MRGKIILLIFLAAANLISCVKKYDYGNIQTPDVLLSRDEGGSSVLPVLSGKRDLAPTLILDGEGCDFLANEIRSFPTEAVYLDLSGCTVPEDEKYGAVLPSGFFSGMSNLVSVILPEGLETVGENLFADCVSLKSLVLPSGLHSVEGHAFSGCRSLSEIRAPDHPLFIFSYSGDGLEYPDGKCSCRNARVLTGESSRDYESWYMDCWRYSKSVEPLPVFFSEIWASSFQAGYGPENLSDGSWKSWFENEKGEGIGSRIVMSFTRENPVSTITIRNGNGNTENFWSCNRVKDLEIYFGDEKDPELITLKDTPEPQTYRFLYGPRKKKRYTKITVVIKSVYSGGKGNETCISEISLNDEGADFTADSLSRKMEQALDKYEEEHFSEGTATERKIWREEGRAALAVLLEEDGAKDVNLLAFDGSSWKAAGTECGKSVMAALSECRSLGKEPSFSLGGYDDGFDLSLQMMRRVEGFDDASYGRPYSFSFSDGSFRMTDRPDLELKRIEAEAKDFFSVLEGLDARGLYRIDLYGKLDRKFFERMHSVLSPDARLFRERNYILNLWNCSLADELEDCIEEGFISGYFIQLVLPSCTKVIRRGALSVAADLITLPAGIRRIESGAFVAGNGNPFDVVPNHISFDGGEPAGYSVEGNLLLEDIPDSGGKKSVLLYMGQAEKIISGISPLHPEDIRLPENVASLSPYSFYAADISSLVFPGTFSAAGERCMDLMKVRKIDLSACDVESFSLGTVREFGKASSANEGMEMKGKLLCISASGKMTGAMVERVEKEVRKNKDKKIFLDLSATSLVWEEKARKFVPLPDFFLYDNQNLIWLMLGQYNYIPSNTCRDCRNLGWVGFVQEPEKISEPAFKGCRAGAKALVGGEERDLWEYARSKRF